MFELWPKGHVPLMLAPMQGLTNRALRSVYAETVQPDVMFTEFVRVRPKAKEPIAKSDFVEALAVAEGIPLVVQVIGSADEGVLEACQELVARGVQHINVNMGCPFGRMTSVLAGGGMFRAPEGVAPMLKQLRKIVPGSLSVKTRTGLEDERQLLSMLSQFEGAGLDFLIIHPRTVAQKYKGAANHDLTREIVSACSFPVIANGDIRLPEQAQAVLERTGAAGLMLGRGAISDPWLFARIRGTSPARRTGVERKRQLAEHLGRLLEGYQSIFFGDAQVLSKLRECLAHIDDPDLRRWVRGLKKTRSVDFFAAAIVEAAG